MSAQSYTKCLSWLLMDEGGFVDNPHDPGGVTNRGVTQDVYDGWRIRQGQLRQTVRLISADEVSAIYKIQYWDAVHGDDMPSGLDWCLMDEAVNSGPGKSIIDLQTALGVRADGVIGLVTMGRVRGVSDPSVLIEKICAVRLSFLHRLLTWRFFGAGWSARVRRTQVQALSLVTH